MNKFLSLFLLIILVNNMVVKTEPESSRIQAVGEAFLSKPAMILYGIIVGTGAVVIVNKLKTMHIENDATLKKGKEISEAAEQLSDILIYLEKIANTKCLKFDKCRWETDIEVKSSYNADENDVKNATRLLERVKRELEAYNAYHRSKAFPTVDFRCTKDDNGDLSKINIERGSCDQY